MAVDLAALGPTEAPDGGQTLPSCVAGPNSARPARNWGGGFALQAEHKQAAPRFLKGGGAGARDPILSL